MAEQDHDRDSIDRAFAELVAGYHLTAERPDEPRALELSTELASAEEPRVEAAEPSEAVALPVQPDPPVLPLAWRAGPDETRPTDEHYVPDPLPPLGRPGAPALVGWAAVLFASVVVLAAGFGVQLPTWLGYLAVSCFVLGSVVLLTQLPRHRPPDAGDGAVL